MGDETFCLVLRRLSLLMKICAQRKAGRRKRASTSLVSLSRGPLRFVTSHWRFTFASMWKNTKHLRRRKISAHHLVLDRRDKNQYPVAELYPSLFSLVTKSCNTPPPHRPHPKKKKREKKISTKDKLNKNKYICQLPFSRSYMSFLKYHAEKKGESDWCHELFQKSASGKASQV